MKKIALAFFVIFCSFFLNSLSLNDEVSFLIKPGEKPSIRQFSSEGQPYYLVEINSIPALIFGKIGDGFYLVTEDKHLQTLVSDYVYYSLNDGLSSANWSKAREYFNLLDSNISECISGYKIFSKNQGVGTPYFVVSRMGFTDVSVCPRVVSSETSIIANNYFKKLSSAIDSLTQTRLNLSISFLKLSSGNLSKDESIAELYNLRIALNRIDAFYAASFDGFAGLSFYCYRPFGNYSCINNTRLLSLINSFANASGISRDFDKDSLFSKIRKETLKRNAFGLISKYYFIRSRQYSSISERLKELESRFSSVRPTKFIVLTAKTNALLNELKDLKNSPTVSTAQEFASRFDSKYNEIDSLLSHYSSILSDYQLAQQTIYETDQTLSEFSKNVGEKNLKSVEALREFISLKTRLDSISSDISSGKRVSEKELSSIISETQELKTRLISYSKEESAFPVLPIATAGIVIALALAWFFKFGREKGISGLFPLFNLFKKKEESEYGSQEESGGSVQENSSEENYP